MKVPRIDEPVRLTGPFWTTLVLAEAVFCWYFKPWGWDYPLWYRCIGATLPPFLGAFATYCVMLFFVSLVTNFCSQAQTLAMFWFAVCAGGIVLAFAWVRAGFRDVPVTATFTAAFLANTLFANLVKTRRNQDVGQLIHQTDKSGERHA